MKIKIKIKVAEPSEASLILFCFELVTLGGGKERVDFDDLITKLKINSPPSYIGLVLIKC